MLCVKVIASEYKKSHCLIIPVRWTEPLCVEA